MQEGQEVMELRADAAGTGSDGAEGRCSRDRK